MKIDANEYAKVIARNLRRLMYERDISQSKMCADLNIPKQTVSSWMNGKRTPKMSMIDTLCEYLNCTRSDLMEPGDEKTRSAVLGTRIPVLGKVAAGIPISAIQDILDYEEISDIMGRNGEYFGLRIKGDSMSPRIAEGDTVIVRCQSDAESGDIVIAQINGDAATCKKLIKHKEGVSLVSLNPLYEPMFYSNEDIEKLPVLILGKVVENRSKF